ncbi:putative nucleoredoxin 1 [Apium graveolens]|uniref:putative nucleoredoxin 1 n=1 Tax=Apium graveolens TaxID=4045 RepID=UPI003D796A50
MRGLGRLIVGGRFLTKPTNTRNLTTRIFRKINSTPCTSRTISSRYAYAYRKSCYVFQFRGYFQSTVYHTEVAGRTELKKGDIISLNELLFTSNRDYLVKNNNQHVKADELKGKVVLLYFMPLSGHCIPYNNKDAFSADLKDVYNDLLPLNNFEVVLVVQDDHCEGQIIPVSSTTDPQEEFKDLFSSMPWTAIPFSDAGSRKRIENRLFKREEYGPPVMFVIDSTGIILQTHHVWDILRDFGALGFPFSDTRINFLQAEDDAAAKNPSLNTLLASPQRSYVISNKGDQV